MDVLQKAKIYWKLDYEGGYEYLIHGNDFKGQDADFDLLVEAYRSASNALDNFLAEGETVDPEPMYEETD